MTITVTITGDVPTILSEMRSFLGAVANENVSHPAPAAEPTPKPAARRGRPPKAAETAPEPPESPQETSTQEPEPTPAPPAVEAPAAASVDVAEVRKALIAVVQKIGKAECAALCQKHGGANLTALDPAVYPALLADARAMLEKAAG